MAVSKLKAYIVRQSLVIPCRDNCALTTQTVHKSKAYMYKYYLLSDTWKRFKEAVKSRDGYRCVECNSPNNLHVHHKIYYQYRKPWDYTIDLLETLCANCHTVKHSNKSIKEFCVKDRKEFMRIKREERAKYRKMYNEKNIFKRGMTAKEIYDLLNK